MEIGLDADGFDCSGFVLRALADVHGYTIAPELRHSRQIWQDSQDIQRLVIPGEEKPGNLAVFQYRWDTPQGTKYVPAHIAIVSAVPRNGPTRVIHAKSSEKKVMETPIKRDRLLGYVALTPR